MIVHLISASNIIDVVVQWMLFIHDLHPGGSYRANGTPKNQCIGEVNPEALFASEVHAQGLAVRSLQVEQEAGDEGRLNTGIFNESINQMSGW